METGEKEEVQWKRELKREKKQTKNILLHNVSPHGSELIASLKIKRAAEKTLKV